MRRGRNARHGTIFGHIAGLGSGMRVATTAEEATCLALVASSEPRPRG